MLFEGLKEEIHSSQERLDNLSGLDMTPESGGKDFPILEDMNSPTVEETLDILHKRLTDKRRDNSRPEDLTVSSAII